MVVRSSEAESPRLIYFFYPSGRCAKMSNTRFCFGGSLCVFFLYFCAEVAPQAPPCHNLNLSQSKHVRGPMMDSRVLHTSVTKKNT